MPTIDELGSHAAAQLSDQVRTGTDVEARLAELHASGATVLPLRRRVPPRVWSAAASVAIIAIGAIGIVALRSGGGGGCGVGGKARACWKVLYRMTYDLDTHSMLYGIMLYSLLYVTLCI